MELIVLVLITALIIWLLFLLVKFIFSAIAGFFVSIFDNIGIILIVIAAIYFIYIFISKLIQNIKTGSVNSGNNFNNNNFNNNNFNNNNFNNNNFNNNNFNSKRKKTNVNPNKKNKTSAAPVQAGNNTNTVLDDCETKLKEIKNNIDSLDFINNQNNINNLNKLIDKFNEKGGCYETAKLEVAISINLSDQFNLINSNIVSINQKIDNLNNDLNNHNISNNIKKIDQ